MEHGRSGSQFTPSEAWWPDGEGGGMFHVEHSLATNPLGRNETFMLDSFGEKICGDFRKVVASRAMCLYSRCRW